jgi:hypothetical protein
LQQFLAALFFSLFAIFFSFSSYLFGLCSVGNFEVQVMLSLYLPGHYVQSVTPCELAL